jgi:hypothetical protein
MKRFDIVAAQGEIIIRRVDAIPTDCEAVMPKDGIFSIAPSRNGHNHVMDADGSTVFKLDQPPAGMRILYAIVENSTALRHLRRRHTHAPIRLDPGMYEFRVAREYNPYAGLVVMASEQEPPENLRYTEIGGWIWQWPLLEKWLKSTRAIFGSNISSAGA